MKATTKVQLTNSELIKAVLASFSKQVLVSAIRKQYPELPESFEFEVVEDVKEELVKEHKLDNEGWIDVPEDWNEPRCPTFIGDCSIEVIYRWGGREEGYPADWRYGWVQEDLGADIVRYRAKP